MKDVNNTYSDFFFLVSESSDDEPNQLSQNTVTTNSSVRSSPAPRQFGCTSKKANRANWSNKKDENPGVKSASPKMVDLTFQLKELLGSDI